jgi:hypothetical protein
MIIVNADDWGRTEAETDVALACYRSGGITSVTAMVFMEDSQRAARLALEAGLDVGLHLNLSEPFSGRGPAGLEGRQDRVVRYMTSSKYAFLLYNPSLSQDFHYTFRSQVDEFVRIYGKAPSHIDGHHHKHLCTNILMGNVIPAGSRVRRNFTFWPEDKSLPNRLYRRAVDRWLSSRYRLTDYFFSLSYCLRKNYMERVTDLSRSANVEVMTHPSSPDEHAYLTNESYLSALAHLNRGSYGSL